MWVKKMKNYQSVPVRELASLIGLLNSTRVQHDRASLYLVKLNRVKCGTVAKEGWEGQFIITHMVSGELAWWERVIAENYPASLIPPPQPDAHLFVDASPAGWGAWLHQSNERYHAFGAWPANVKTQTSNFHEMLAVSCAVKSYSSRMLLRSGIHVRIHSDNSSTVFNIQRKAAARNLFHPLRDLFNWCDKSDIIISAQHVKGIHNSVADSLSRLSRSGDYSLKRGVFNRICSTLQVKPVIEMFASGSNRQLPIIISPVLGDNTLVRDALGIRWTGQLNFVHPPIPLIGRCLRKVLAENASALVVVPNWKGQSWNNLLNKLSKKMLIIGKSEDVLLPGKIMNRKGDKLPPGFLAAHLLQPPYIL
jgi:hypothetical protein